jgi:hypothetical protein
MEFGLNKYVKFVLKEKKISSLTKFNASLQQRIQELEQNKT